MFVWVVPSPLYSSPIPFCSCLKCMPIVLYHSFPSFAILVPASHSLSIFIFSPCSILPVLAWGEGNLLKKNFSTCLKNAEKIWKKFNHCWKTYLKFPNDRISEQDNPKQGNNAYWGEKKPQKWLLSNSAFWYRIWILGLLSQLSIVHPPQWEAS